jgi:hypothetical protein
MDKSAQLCIAPVNETFDTIMLKSHDMLQESMVPFPILYFILPLHASHDTANRQYS